jgi:hypothetical protein
MPGNKPKAWEIRITSRAQAGTLDRRRVLIVCEDTKSSCFYFKKFPIAPERAEVRISGTGMNTDSLVEETIRINENAAKQRRPYSRIWCVMDRDSFPLGNYSRAFDLARRNHISVAWANEAFELWYLLHFNYHDTGISRDDYKPRLEKLLAQAYDKADDKIYSLLSERQPTAIKHARRLEKHWRELEERFPERQNPSTNIHKLVEFLNELSDLGPVAED